MQIHFETGKLENIAKKCFASKERKLNGIFEWHILCLAWCCCLGWRIWYLLRSLREKNLCKSLPSLFMTNMNYDLTSRFKWLNSFYDFIPQVYIQRYVCQSATNQIHKQIDRKSKLKRGKCKAQYLWWTWLASSFLLAPLPPKLALTTDSREFFDKLLNFTAASSTN